MPTDNPYPSPPPCQLADMLAMHAWRNDIDDDSRRLAEWAADWIRELIKRNAHHAARAERVDAKCERYAEYMLSAGVTPPSLRGAE